VEDHGLCNITYFLCLLMHRKNSQFLISACIYKLVLHSYIFYFLNISIPFKTSDCGISEKVDLCQAKYLSMGLQLGKIHTVKILAKLLVIKNTPLIFTSISLEYCIHKIKAQPSFTF